MKILIDPGHGGTFPGACAGGTRECDVTLEVAKSLMYILRSEGCTAYLTRDGDYNLGPTVSRDLARRCEISNSLHPDLFISLHCNAHGSAEAKGVEVWTSPGQTASDEYATRILASLGKAFPGRKIRSDWSDEDADKEAKFFVLMKTSAPAVLVEMGFLTNREEREWLLDHTVPMARAIAGGILREGGTK